MKEREALKLALEALENRINGMCPSLKEQQTITAIKEALAQPAQEPVAIVEASWNDDEGFMLVKRLAEKLPKGSHLYTTPPQRKPLTDEQQILKAIIDRQNNTWGQGGALGYMGDGQWSFASSSISVTPDEMNALFKLAGVEPKVIISKGDCSDCAHAVNGRERGYERPCSNCQRPIMSNFEAAHSIKE